MIVIGTPVWLIKRADGYKYEIVEKKITGYVSHPNRRPTIYLDFEKEIGVTIDKISCGWHNYHQRAFFSKKKAERVAKNLTEIEQEEQKRTKREEKKREEILEFNKKWIKTLPIVGKDVIVKDPAGKDGWSEGKITELKPSNKRKKSFWFVCNRNIFKSEKEGITWRFNLKIDDLRKQKEQLEKQIEEMENFEKLRGK